MTKGIKILIFAQSYFPEEVSGAVLVTELATDLAAAGHQVTVVTCAPNYPYGKVFTGYQNAWCSREELNGVQVIRTWSYISPRKTFWRRILNYGTYTATSLYGGMATGKPDIVLCFTPPLPLGLSAWLVSRKWGIPLVLQIEDLYPDAAVAAGWLTNSAAIRFFANMEHFIYRKATKISVISKMFRDNLLHKGVDHRKVTVIPVWADPDLVSPAEKENRFRLHYDLGGKFVVMYAGNHGITACLENVLSAAERLQCDSNIKFVFIGEGVQKDFLAKRAISMGLRNTLFLPYQPRELFCEMMAAADVNVVTINLASCMTSLPSKTFNIMASERPVLAIGPQESELCQLVRETECGLAVSIESVDQLVESIRKLKNDKESLRRLGENGRATLLSTYSRSRCVGMLENLLVELHSTWNRRAGYERRNF
jgi:colanic acid biosynthesis glycosyl transferase WcaI